MLGCFNPILGQIWTNPAVRLNLLIAVFNPTFRFVHIYRVHYQYHAVAICLEFLHASLCAHVCNVLWWGKKKHIVVLC